MRYLLLVLLISTCLVAQNNPGATLPATSSAPDSAAKTSATKGSSAATPAGSKEGGWKVQNHTAPDGSREVALVLDSESAADKSAESRQAHLVIRCSKQKPEVFINIGARFESVPEKPEGVNVRTKFDGAAPQDLV